MGRLSSVKEVTSVVHPEGVVVFVDREFVVEGSVSLVTVLSGRLRDHCNELVPLRTGRDLTPSLDESPLSRRTSTSQGLQGGCVDVCPGERVVSVGGVLSFNMWYLFGQRRSPRSLYLTLIIVMDSTLRQLSNFLVCTYLTNLVTDRMSSVNLSSSIVLLLF